MVGLVGDTSLSQSPALQGENPNRWELVAMKLAQKISPIASMGPWYIYKYKEKHIISFIISS